MNNHNVAVKLYILQTRGQSLSPNVAARGETINDLSQKEEVRSVLGGAMNNGEP